MATLQILKKQYLLACAFYLAIPAVVLLGGLVFNTINPEIAVKYPNYERNYRLLELAKNLSMLSAFLIALVLWFLTCFFLLKSKGQSYRWLPWALLGPFGFIALTMLRDKAPASCDRYQRFVQRQNLFVRTAYELGFCAVVWVLAYQAIVFKRDLMISLEAAATGVSTTQIIKIQNASSGMWAAGEGMEELYLVVTVYLLWPIFFNLVVRLNK
jgi:hypothetical protein